MNKRKTYTAELIVTGYILGGWGWGGGGVCVKH